MSILPFYSFIRLQQIGCRKNVAFVSRSLFNFFIFLNWSGDIRDKRQRGVPSFFFETSFLNFEISRRESHEETQMPF